MAEVVVTRMTITVMDRTMPTPNTPAKAASAREAMRSVKGTSIRTPCINNRSMFTRDRPAYRLPRAHGTGTTAMSRLYQGQPNSRCRRMGARVFAWPATPYRPHRCRSRTVTPVDVRNRMRREIHQSEADRPRRLVRRAMHAADCAVQAGWAKGWIKRGRSSG